MARIRYCEAAGEAQSDLGHIPHFISGHVVCHGSKLFDKVDTGDEENTCSRPDSTPSDGPIELARTSSPKPRLVGCRQNMLFL